MKKLEDIPKKEIFNVPEGYFEELPGIIRARVAKPDKQHEGAPLLAYNLRFAMGLAVLAIAAIFWFERPEARQSPELMLSDVGTEALIAYIQDSDQTTDELLDDVSLGVADADEISDAVYGLDWTDETLINIIDEID